MREKATSLWFVLAASLLAATDSCGDAGGGFRLPEGSWRLRELAGRELYACFHCSLWAEDWKTAPDWPMMKNVYMIFDGDMPITEVVHDGKEYAVRRPAEKLWKDDPLTFQTVLERNPKMARRIADFEKHRPGMPYTIMLRGYHHPFFMPASFPQLDRKSYLAWKADHPQFHSFYAWDEWDNSMFYYSWATTHISDPALREQIEKAFPLTNDYRKYLNWTEEAARRLRGFYFGETSFTGLISLWPTSCFDLARNGTRLIFYEAELGSTSAPWRWGGAAIRGCSRQYDIPFGWYCATYLNEAYTRDGKMRNGFIYLKSPARPKAVEKLGCSRSLLARNVMYGYFIGANVLQQEKCWDFLGAYGKDGSLVPSVYAEDFNAPFAWDEKHERGVPYTPLAILFSAGEWIQRQHYVPYNRDKFSMFAFLDALVCPHEDQPALCSDRKNGDEGCMFNSPYGEIADILCPDAGQRSEDFLKVLKTYPRAVLVGNFDHLKIDTEALERYVKEGGTLYVEQRLIDLGYVSAWIPDAKGRLVTLPPYLPESFVKSDRPWWPDKMAMLTSGAVECPVIRGIFDKVQEELMPVAVAGDIQWGVNKTTRGWLVWLMNNKGVVHFAGEDETLDATKTATVRITSRKTGRVYSATVAPGGWSTVEISE